MWFYLSLPGFRPHLGPAAHLLEDGPGFRILRTILAPPPSGGEVSCDGASVNKAADCGTLGTRAENNEVKGPVGGQEEAGGGAARCYHNGR